MLTSVAVSQVPCRGPRNEDCYQLQDPGDMAQNQSQWRRYSTACLFPSKSHKQLKKLRQM